MRVSRPEQVAVFESGITSYLSSLALQPPGIAHKARLSQRLPAALAGAAEHHLHGLPLCHGRLQLHQAPLLWPLVPDSTTYHLKPDLADL